MARPMRSRRAWRCLAYTVRDCNSTK
jgi:hypothetical protein